MQARQEIGLNAAFYALSGAFSDDGNQLPYGLLVRGPDALEIAYQPKG